MAFWKSAYSALPLRTEVVLPRALEIAVRLADCEFFSSCVRDCVERPNVLEERVLQSFQSVATEFQRDFGPEVARLAQAVSKDGEFDCEEMMRLAGCSSAFSEIECADEDVEEEQQQRQQQPSESFAWANLVTYILVTGRLMVELEKKRHSASARDDESWTSDRQAMFHLVNLQMKKAFHDRNLLEEADPVNGWKGLLDFDYERSTSHLEFAQWFDEKFTRSRLN